MGLRWEAFVSFGSADHMVAKIKLVDKVEVCFQQDVGPQLFALEQALLLDREPSSAIAVNQNAQLRP